MNLYSVSFGLSSGYNMIMSLTATDLDEIRNIVKSTVSFELRPVINELEMIRNDIKEIYFMIADLQHSSITDQDFKKLSLEKNY